MRPPPLLPQRVSNRSPEILTDLINISRGYKVTIRDSNHRAALLGDCKYYGFKGLMHQIFACSITYNAERGSSEIIMRLEDLHKSGISFYGDASPSDQSPLGGWVYYARPFVDETAYEAIVEIGNEETHIDFRSMRATFYGDTKARISSLFQTVADKMNLPSNLPLGLMMSSGGAAAAPASPANTPLSEDRVKIHIGTDAHIILDGQDYTMDSPNFNPGLAIDFEETPTPSTPPAGSLSWTVPQSPMIPNYHLSPRGMSSIPHHQQQPPQQQPPPPSKKRKRAGSLDEFGEWIVLKGQWRLRVQPRQEVQAPHPVMGQARGRNAVQEPGGMEIVLWAVKMDAVTGQRGRNMGRGWVT